MTPRRTTSAARRSGFTLIEVLVAMFVFLMAVMALSSVRLTSLRSSAQAAALTEGKVRAAAEIERLAGEVLRVTTVNGTNTYAFDTYMTACTLSPTTPPCRGTSGSVTWQVTPETPGVFSGEGLLRLTATADLGGGRSLTLMQMVSCYDVFPSPTRDTPLPCPAVNMPAEEGS